MRTITELKRYRIREFLAPYVILFIFSTSLWLFITDSMLNLLQIFILLVFSSIYVTRLKIDKGSVYIWLFLFSLVISIIINGVSSLMPFFYTSCFSMTFLTYKKYVDSGKITAYHFLLIIKAIIYLYAIVLVIQQISLLVGIPVINGVGDIYERGSCNSLSNEPSHTSRIILLLFVSYLYMETILSNQLYSLRRLLKDDLWMFVLFSYIELSTGSGTGIVAFVLFFLFFFKRRYLVFLLIVAVIAYYLIQTIDIPTVIRVRELLNVLFTLDTELIRLADNSASARINPYLYYFEDFDISSFKIWFGFGDGYAEPILIEKVLGHETDLTTGAGGIFPVLFYDYGLFSGLCFLFILMKYCFRLSTPFYIMLWVLIFASTGLNTYMQWLFISVTYSVNYYQQNRIKDETINYCRS